MAKLLHFEWEMAIHGNTFILTFFVDLLRGGFRGKGANAPSLI